MVEPAHPIDEDHENIAAALQIDEVRNLRKELEGEREKATEYLNRLKYLQADFENYKKRVKKEIDDAVDYAQRKLVLELLMVIDELECALEAGNQDAGSALLEGVKMTLGKLQNILKKEGLSRIDTAGKTFDPTRHEAALRVQSSQEEGVILEEIRKGYLFKEKVLRPSLVKVAGNLSLKGENE